MIRPLAREGREGLDLIGFSGKMVLMNWFVQAMAGMEKGTVEITEPHIQTRTRPVSGDPANDWLCAWCLNRVASEKDRLYFNGRSEFAFKNPAGIKFHIITFSKTVGCREVGVPTLADTWFAGHAWSYCLCKRCGMHLGWHYSGPSEFDGLIRDRIVLAAVVMN